MSESAFIIDRDEVFAAGLKYLLSEKLDIEVVGVSRYAVAVEHRLRSKTPSIVFVDPFGMTHETLALCEHIQEWPTQPKIAIISETLSGPRLKTWLSYEFSGYILKPITLADLSGAINALRRGQGFKCPNLGLGGLDQPLKTSSDPLAQLSNREQEIFVRIVNGKSAAQIAAEFHISIKTAEWHRRNVFAKIGVPNVALLTKFAIREGLIALD